MTRVKPARCVRVDPRGLSSPSRRLCGHASLTPAALCVCVEREREREREMRRRSIRHSEVNLCPMCRKAVEFGMQCEACASWFHATEQCCGDALSNAFTTSGREAWTCLNCYPQQGAPPAADALKKHAATIDHIEWRRAFRILTDSCAGCGLKVRERARGRIFMRRRRGAQRAGANSPRAPPHLVVRRSRSAGAKRECCAPLRDLWPRLPCAREMHGLRRQGAEATRRRAVERVRREGRRGCECCWRRGRRRGRC